METNAGNEPYTHELALTKDREAYKATLLPVDQLASFLVERIGLGYTARLAGIGETRAVRDWQARNRAPRWQYENRIRLGARVVALLDDRGNPEIPKAWLALPCPYLRNAVPIETIAAVTTDEAGEEKAREVLRAALSSLELFISGQL